MISLSELIINGSFSSIHIMGDVYTYINFGRLRSRKIGEGGKGKGYRYENKAETFTYAKINVKIMYKLCTYIFGKNQKYALK